MSERNRYFDFSASWSYDGDIVDDIMEAKRDSIIRALTAIALLIERKIKEKLNQHGSGRVYPSKRGSGTHQASAKGEAPAPDTTDYRNSWRATATESMGTFAVSVMSPLWWVFGRRLEYGGQGRSSSYTAPRPHVRPVLLENEAEINRILDTI